MAMMSPVPEQLHNHHHHQMHITEQIINFKLKERKQLSLENYLSFLQSGDSANFTVDQLNQIISIHSFKKAAQRKQAVEAVKAIEPIQATRSTLSEDISSSTKAASMEFNEAIKDLKALNWQECSITSFKSIKPENGKLIVNLPSTAATKSASLKAAKKPKLASSMKSSSSVLNNSGCSGGDSLVPVIPSAKATTMRKTIKRPKLSSLTESSCSGSSNGSGGSGGCSSSSLTAGGKRGGRKKKLHAIVCLGTS